MRPSIPPPNIGAPPNLSSFGQRPIGTNIPPPLSAGPKFSTAIPPPLTTKPGAQPPPLLGFQGSSIPPPVSSAFTSPMQTSFNNSSSSGNYNTLSSTLPKQQIPQSQPNLQIASNIYSPLSTTGGLRSSIGAVPPPLVPSTHRSSLGTIGAPGTLLRTSSGPSSILQSQQPEQQQPQQQQPQQSILETNSNLNTNTTAATTTTTITSTSTSTAAKVSAPQVVNNNTENKSEVIPQKVDFSIGKVNLPKIEFKKFPFDDKIPSNSQKYAVDNNNNGVTLQNAIEQAPEGSTLIVKNGKYSTNCLKINKSLHFVADGKVSIRSDGSGEIFIIGGNNTLVTLNGFHIKQKLSKSRGAIVVNSGSLYLENCLLSTTSIATIQLKNDSLLRAKSCLIFGGNCSAIVALSNAQIDLFSCSVAKSKTCGIVLKGSTKGKFTQCVAHSCPKGAIQTIDNSQIYVDSCNFNSCNIEISSFGMSSENANGSSKIEHLIAGNTFQYNGSGVLVANSANVHIVQNKLISSLVDIRDNAKCILANNNYDCGSLLVWGSSVVEATNEEFIGENPACVGISNTSSLVLKNAKFNSVKGSGVVAYGQSHAELHSCKFTSVSQSAIIAHSGNELLCKDIEINKTGEISVLLSQLNSASFERLTIKNGESTAVEITDSSNITFQNCEFDSNKKCGMFLSDSPHISVTNSTFSRNSYSAVHLCRSALVMNNNKIKGNLKGGLFACQDSNIVLQDSEFTQNNNVWSCIHVDKTSKGSLANCRFEDNNNSIGLSVGGKVDVRNCHFLRHPSTAIQISGGNLDITDSEISMNGVGIIAADNGTLVSNKNTFKSNNVHVEATRSANLSFFVSNFSLSSGEMSLHVTEGAILKMDQCTIKDSKGTAAIISEEGETNLRKCSISKSAKVGIIAGKNSSGKIENCVFDENGECGVQCTNGANTIIIGNEIKNNKKFGIFMAAKATPSIENNSFERNELANIWRE